MQKHEGKIGAIRRNVHGRACFCCGSRSYQLVLRSVNEREVGKLFARCKQCTLPEKSMKTLNGYCGSSQGDGKRKVRPTAGT